MYQSWDKDEPYDWELAAEVACCSSGGSIPRSPRYSAQQPVCKRQRPCARPSDHP